MGFPSIFYCVCGKSDCSWSKYPIGERDDDAVDERVARLPGSSYWNTCQYYKVIVFEALFVRALREFVRDGAVSFDALLEILDHLAGRWRPGSELERQHIDALRRIDQYLNALSGEVGRVDSHFSEIIRRAREFVFHSRALLDECREPGYWPDGRETDAAVAKITVARACATNAAELARGTYRRRTETPPSAAGRTSSAGRRVA